MDGAVITLSVALVAFGCAITWLLTERGNMLDQIDNMYEAIISMAKELKSLGSTNVFIEEVKDEL